MVKTFSKKLFSSLFIPRKNKLDRFVLAKILCAKSHYSKHTLGVQSDKSYLFANIIFTGAGLSVICGRSLLMFIIS
jgi:hypothetical protein